jgi:hypothetical protein
MIVTVWVPTGAPDTVTVRVDDLVPAMGGVTGFVSNINIMPSGTPEAFRLTGEKNTPRDWIVMVEVPAAPAGRDR